MKINKKQKEAIEKLTYDLDELDNKPRRLFSALITFADAFLDDNSLDNKEHKLEVMDSIDEFERAYYRYLRVPQIMKDVGESVKVVNRKLLSRKLDDEDPYKNRYIIEKTCKEIAKEILNRLVDHLDS